MCVVTRECVCVCVYLFHVLAACMLHGVRCAIQINKRKNKKQRAASARWRVYGTEKSASSVLSLSQTVHNFLHFRIMERRKKRQLVSGLRHQDGSELFIFVKQKPFRQQRSNNESHQGEKRDSTLSDFTFSECFRGFQRWAYGSTTYTPCQKPIRRHAKYVFEKVDADWCSALGTHRSQISSLAFNGEYTKTEHGRKQYTREAKTTSHLRQYLLLPSLCASLCGQNCAQAPCIVSAPHTLESSSLPFVLCVYVCAVRTVHMQRRLRETPFCEVKCERDYIFFAFVHSQLQ